MVDRAWAALQESSWAGVDLFFVLSGFLITGILLDSRSARGYFSNFYARRTLRIFPLYYGVLTIALLIVPAAVGFHRLPALYPRLIENQVWLWTYLANFIQAREPHTLPGFGHFWSLAVEEQFYWFWPLIVYFSGRRLLLRLCLAACILLPIVRFAMLFTGSQPWALRQYTFTRFDTLLAGALIAFVLRDAALTRFARAFAPSLTISAALVLSLIALRCGFVPFESPVTLVAGYTAWAAVFSAILFRLASPEFSADPAHPVLRTRKDALETFFSARVLRFFGKYSYAIYVFHWPITQALQGTVERRLPQSEMLAASCLFCAVLTASSAAAWISWYGFESHFLKLKKYFEYAEPVPSNPLVSSGGGEHGPDGLADNAEVQDGRPAGNILAVERDALIVSGVASPGHLPQPGDSGTHGAIRPESLPIERNLSLHDGPGADHAHLPDQYVPKLR